MFVRLSCSICSSIRSEVKYSLLDAINCSLFISPPYVSRVYLACCLEQWMSAAHIGDAGNSWCAKASRALLLRVCPGLLRFLHCEDHSQSAAVTFPAVILEDGVRDRVSRVPHPASVPPVQD